MREGMLGVIIISLAFAGAGFAQYLGGMEAIEHETVDYKYLADVSGLFKYEEYPQYIEYDPAANYTGYYGQTGTFPVNELGYVSYNDDPLYPEKTNNYQIRNSAYETVTTGTITDMPDTSASKNWEVTYHDYQSDGPYEGQLGPYDWYLGYRPSHLTIYDLIWGGAQSYSGIGSKTFSEAGVSILDTTYDLQISIDPSGSGYLEVNGGEYQTIRFHYLSSLSVSYQDEVLSITTSGLIPETVTITAVNNPGYTFAGWEGITSGSSVTSDTAIQQLFVQGTGPTGPFTDDIWDGTLERWAQNILDLYSPETIEDGTKTIAMSVGSTYPYLEYIDTDAIMYIPSSWVTDATSKQLLDLGSDEWLEDNASSGIYAPCYSARVHLMEGYVDLYRSTDCSGTPQYSNLSLSSVYVCWGGSALNELNYLVLGDSLEYGVYIDPTYYLDPNYGVVFTEDSNQGCTVTFTIASGNGSICLDGVRYGSTLSLNVLSGTTIVADGDDIIIGGAYTISGLAFTGYAFGSWSALSSGTVTSDMTVSATFLKTYTVTVTVRDIDADVETDVGYLSYTDGTETVTGESAAIPAIYGTSISASGDVLIIGDVEVTVIPGGNFAFDSWSNASGTVTGKRTVYANVYRVSQDVTVLTHSTYGKLAIYDTTDGTMTSDTTVTVTVPLSTVQTVSGDLLTVGDTQIVAVNGTPETIETILDEAGSTLTVSVGDLLVISPADGTHYSTVISMTGSIGLALWEDDAELVGQKGLVSSEGTAVITWGLYQQSWGGDTLLSTNTITITATAPESIHPFEEWVGAPVTVTGDRTITANFGDLVHYQVQVGMGQGYIIYTADGTQKAVQTAVGTVLRNSQAEMDGNILTIGGIAYKAVPTPGYTFSSWSGLQTGDYLSSQYNPVSAIFTQDEGHKVHVAVGTGSGAFTYTDDEGSHTVQSLDITVEDGTEVSADGSVLTIGDISYTAVPDGDYRLVGWSWAPAGETVTSDTYAMCNFGLEDEDEVTVTIKVGIGKGYIRYANGSSSVSTQSLSVSVPVGTSVSADGQVLTLGGTEYTATTNRMSSDFNSWGGVPNTQSITKDTVITAKFDTIAVYTVILQVNPAYPSDPGDIIYTVSSTGTEYQAQYIQFSVPVRTAYSIDGDTLTVNGTTYQAVSTTGYSFSRWSMDPALDTIRMDSTATQYFTEDEE